jgi:hypothetical protein
MHAQHDTQRTTNIVTQRREPCAVHFVSVNQAQFEFSSRLRKTRARKKFFCARRNFFVALARSASLSIEKIFAQPTRFRPFATVQTIKNERISDK